MNDYTESPQERNARRKAEREAAALQRQRDQVLFDLLGAPAGRDWVYDLLSRCGIYQIGFVPGQPDSTAFNLGQRNIGLGLMADITRVAPDLYVEMLQEQKDGRRTGNASNGRDDTTADIGEYDPTAGDAESADQPVG